MTENKPGTGNPQNTPWSTKVKAGLVFAAAAGGGFVAVNNTHCDGPRNGQVRSHNEPPLGIPKNAVFVDTGESGEKIWLSIQPPEKESRLAWLRVWTQHNDGKITTCQQAFDMLTSHETKDKIPAGKRGYTFFNSFNPKQTHVVHLDDKPPLNQETLSTFRDALRTFHASGVSYEYMFAGFQNGGNNYTPFPTGSDETAILVDKGKYGEYIWIMDHSPAGAHDVSFSIHVSQGKACKSENFSLKEGDPERWRRTDPIILRDRKQPHRKIEIPINDIFHLPKNQIVFGGGFIDIERVATELRSLHHKGAEYEDILERLYNGIDRSKAANNLRE